MYFTRFPINVTRRETRSLLASPYRLHAALSGSFPANASTETGRLLWRVDNNGDSKWLYIVSPQRPSLIGLDEQMGWPDLPKQWETKPYEGFLQQIRVGQLYRFRLAANPSVSRHVIQDERGHSKRIPHQTVLQQAAWLAGKGVYEGTGIAIPGLFERERESRAERNGFKICRSLNGTGLEMVVSDVRKQTFRQGSSGRMITLSTARYDGVLEVCEADALRHALVKGIGHGKGFGCGLLTLVPKE